MKSGLTILFAILVMVSAEHLLLPRPKLITTGNENLRVSRCALTYAKTEDNEFQELIKIHEGDLLLSGKECQNHGITSKSFVIFAQRTGPVTSEKCMDESYTIDVTLSEARMTAKCPVGLIRAMVTLYQLSVFHEESKEIEIEGVPVHIEDSPRFEHRGLMIDTARHFLKKATIARILDGMMYAKLNVLHWHIIDDDSFPMQSQSFPGLAESASFGPQFMYKVEDIKELVAYAATRGVRVIPEFDNPGHARAVGLYAPLKDLVTCFNTVWPYNVPDVYRIRGGPSTGALDPSMAGTYEFVKGILKDAVSYFKDDMVHMGGDEVSEKCWDERPAIKEFMKQNGIVDFDGLMTYYYNRTKGILASVDPSKKPVFWLAEEQFKVKFPRGDILQYWGLSTNVKRAYDLFPFNKFIMSPHDYLYLDCGYENPFGGTAWCGDFKTWARIYSFEPTNFDIPENKILGAEACAWSELNNNDNIETKLWPRMLPLAETLWEPKRTKEADLSSLMIRMTEFSARLNNMGIRTTAITGQYCEINAKECFQKWE